MTIRRYVRLGIRRRDEEYGRGQRAVVACGRVLGLESGDDPSRII
jgi:hypothetical protein